MGATAMVGVGGWGPGGFSILGFPFYERDCDCYLAAPQKKSQITRPPNPNHPLTSWWFQIFFIFTPTWGKIPILTNIFTHVCEWDAVTLSGWAVLRQGVVTNIFQMGWNHQLVNHWLIIFPERPKKDYL